MENSSPQSNYLSMKSSLKTSLSNSQPFFSFQSYRCDRHKEKNLNIICTYQRCKDKGLICSICQYENHLAHSQYCFPWEIFLEKSENYRSKNKEIIQNLKEKFKAINTSSKKSAKVFTSKVNEIYKRISSDIDKNIDLQINLMQEVLKRDKLLQQDLIKQDENKEDYKKKIKSHLENVQVEVDIEKAESISFFCRDSENFLYQLNSVLAESQNFEKYLEEFLGHFLLDHIAKMYGMNYFKCDNVKQEESPHKSNIIINGNMSTRSFSNIIDEDNKSFGTKYPNLNNENNGKYLFSLIYN